MKYPLKRCPAVLCANISCTKYASSASNGVSEETWKIEKVAEIYNITIWLVLSLQQKIIIYMVINTFLSILFINEFMSAGSLAVV